MIYEYPWHEAPCFPAKPKPKEKRKVKGLIVIAEETVQKTGQLEIPAPVGITVDPETGNLMPPVQLEPLAEPVLQPQIIPDKLVNEGSVLVKLVVKDIDPNPCPDTSKFPPKQVVVPIQSVHEIIGIKPGDHIQEFPEVEFLSATAIHDSLQESAGTTLRLALKVIVKSKIIIARECIFLAAVDILRCLPPDGKNCS